MKQNKLRIPALLLSMVLLLGLLAACGGGNDGGNGGSAGTTPPVGTTEPAGTPAGDQGGSGDGNAVAVTEWEIPMLTAATGAIAYVGKPAGWAAEYAAQIINENGGIRGVPVKITVLDTAFDTSKAVTQMTSVVDDALVVLGPMDAPGAESAGQVAFDGGVPNIAAYSFQDIRDLYAPYVMGYMTDSEEGDLAAVQEWTTVNDDIKKIVVFYTPTDASQAASTELLKAELPNSGIEVVGTVEVQTGQLDCSASVIQALNMKADGYFLGLRADEAAKVLTELRKRGVDEGRRICATFASFDANYFDVAGSDCEDTYVWNKLDPNYDNPEWQALVEAYKAGNDGQIPTAPPVPGFYDAVMCVKQGIEELELTGAPDKLEEERAALAAWLYDSPEFDGIQGPFRWAAGKKVADVHFFQITGGQPVAVK